MDRNVTLLNLLVGLSQTPPDGAPASLGPDADFRRLLQTIPGPVWAEAA